jgi:serine/threonine protein kinase
VRNNDVEGLKRAILPVEVIYDNIFLSSLAPFATKRLNEEQPFVTIVNEALVGMLALNKLKSPNFVYIYTYFEDNVDEVPTCLLDGIKPCIVEEKIHPITYVYDYLNQTFETYFLRLYLQVILALNYAYERYRFTHYDLHNENVVLLKLEEPRFIPYPYHDTSIYVWTDVIPKIIDYGISRVEVNGKVIGPYHIHYNGKPLANIACPYNDAYRFLAYSLLCYIELNRSIKDLEWLYRFFIKGGSMNKALEEQSNVRYLLPLTDNVVDKPLDDLIEYMLARNICGVQR